MSNLEKIFNFILMTLEELFNFTLDKVIPYIRKKYIDFIISITKAALPIFIYSWIYSVCCYFYGKYLIRKEKKKLKTRVISTEYKKDNWFYDMGNIFVSSNLLKILTISFFVIKILSLSEQRWINVIDDYIFISFEIINYIGGALMLATVCIFTYNYFIGFNYKIVNKKEHEYIIKTNSLIAFVLLSTIYIISYFIFCYAPFWFPVAYYFGIRKLFTYFENKRIINENDFICKDVIVIELNEYDDNLNTNKLVFRIQEATIKINKNGQLVLPIQKIIFDESEIKNICIDNFKYEFKNGKLLIKEQLNIPKLIEIKEVEKNYFRYLQINFEKEVRYIKFWKLNNYVDNLYNEYVKDYYRYHLNNEFVIEDTKDDCKLSPAFMYYFSDANIKEEIIDE